MQKAFVFFLLVFTSLVLGAAIDTTLTGREFDKFVESSTRPGKTAIEVFGTFAAEPPVGGATEEKQDDQITILESLDLKLPALSLSGDRLKVELPAGASGLTNDELREDPLDVTVSNFPSSFSISNFPSTQAISGSVDVDNFPLSFEVSNFPSSITVNAGANLNTSALNLEATQAAISAKLPSSLGAKTTANSLSVGRASDEVPFSKVASTTYSGFGPYTDLELDVEGQGTVLIQLSNGSGLFNVGFYGSLDGVTFDQLSVTDLQLFDGQIPTTAMANGFYRADVTGLKTVRASPTAAGSSSLKVVMRSSQSSSVISQILAQTFVTETNSATINSAVTSLNTKTPSLGQATMANSQPVVIASNQSTIPVSMAAAPTGSATSALQTTGNTSLNSIDTKTPALGQALAASSVPVVLTAAQLSTLTPLSSVSVSNFPTSFQVSNFPATQVVSGSVSANATLSAETTKVIGTVNVSSGQSITANAGANLNTSLLALDSTVAKDASLSTLNTSVNTLLKPASTLTAVTTVGTVSSVTAIANALPTGTNSIGQVTANGGANLNTSALNLETTQSAMSAKLPASLGAKTSAGSLSVTPASDSIYQVAGLNPSGTATTLSETGIDTGNSTSTNLAVGATFTGAWKDVSGFSNLTVLIFSSHASTTDGLNVEYSTDGVTVHDSDSYTIPATNGQQLSFPLPGRYYRIRYVNGGTLTTTLVIQAKLHDTRPKPSAFKLSSLVPDESDVEVVKTYDQQDVGRNVSTLYMNLPVITTATDALVSLTGYKSGAAVVATTTPAVVTTGKRYRITSVAIYYVGIATAGSVKVTLRANTAGTVVIGSPAVNAWVCGATAAVAGVGQACDFEIPDGLEFAAGTGVGVSIVGLNATQVAAATGYVQVAIHGYEY